LSAAALAHHENLDAEPLVRAHPANRAPHPETEPSYCKSEFKRIAGNEAHLLRRTDKAALETKVDELAGDLPVENAELDGTIATLASGSSCVGRLSHVECELSEHAAASEA
jgi:hypothetical protein